MTSYFENGYRFLKDDGLPKESFKIFRGTYHDHNNMT